jgi:hypothetical protein
MLPYRGTTVDDIPNRVWDLPPELQSEVDCDPHDVEVE